MSVPRRRVLLPQPSSILKVGSESRIELGDDARQMLYGRWPHIAAIRLIATFSTTTVAATMDAAATAQDVLAFVKSLRLDAEGHQFFSGQPDLNDVMVHQRIMIGAGTQYAADTIADADATPDVDLDATIKLENPALPESNPRRFDRVIPVALLDHAKNAENVLRFTVPTTPLLGVTVGSFTLTVELDLVYLDLPQVPAESQLAVLDTPDLSTVLQPSGPTPYLLVTRRGDPASVTNVMGQTVENAGSQDLTLNDQLLYANRTTAQIAREYGAQGVRFDDPTPLGLSTSAPEFLPLALCERAAPVSKFHMGRFVSKATSRSLSTTRFVYYDGGLHSQATEARWAARLGAPVEDGRVRYEAVPRTENGGGDAIASFLPHRIMWPGMPGAFAASKRERILARQRALQG